MLATNKICTTGSSTTFQPTQHQGFFVADLKLPADPCHQRPATRPRVREVQFSQSCSFYEFMTKCLGTDMRCNLFDHLTTAATFTLSSHLPSYTLSVFTPALQTSEPLPACLHVPALCWWILRYFCLDPLVMPVSRVFVSGSLISVYLDCLRSSPLCAACLISLTNS